MAIGLFRRPSASLTARIAWLVSCATVGTALLVTAVSVHAIHGFLSRQIDRRVPALLEERIQRLDLWYRQAEVDLDTFARSDTIVTNLARLGHRSGRGSASRARAELRKYLSYVLERSQSYETFLVTNRKGRILLTVGADHRLPNSVRRILGSVEKTRVNEIGGVAGSRLQLASAPVRIPKARIGALHAILNLQKLGSLLAGDDLGPAAEVFLVDSRGQVLTETPHRSLGRRFPRALPSLEARPHRETWRTADGIDVVGAVARFPRFGWALVVEEPYDRAFEPIFRVIWRVLLLDLAIVVALGGVALRIAFSVVRPLKLLSYGAQRVANGETGVSIPEPRGGDELALLTRTFNQMTDSLHQQKLQLHQKNAELELLSITDELTGAYNHRYFREQLSLEVKRADRSGDLLSLLLLDIDDFKKLNDSFGHSAGDEVLRSVAEILHSQIRDTDFLARYGGEEFAVLTTIREPGGAAVIAEKMRAAVASSRLCVETALGEEEVSVSVSVGVATYARDPRHFFNRADMALYAAKNAGKDQVVVAEEMS
ncbi:MAG: diguanylate cyclase [Myxococcota bacterium]